LLVAVAVEVETLGITLLLVVQVELQHLQEQHPHLVVVVVLDGEVVLVQEVGKLQALQQQIHQKVDSQPLVNQTQQMEQFQEVKEHQFLLLYQQHQGHQFHTQLVLAVQQVFLQTMVMDMLAQQVHQAKLTLNIGCNYE
jgi:hypothetical protein